MQEICSLMDITKLGRAEVIHLSVYSPIRRRALPGREREVAQGSPTSDLPVTEQRSGPATRNLTRIRNCQCESLITAREPDKCCAASTLSQKHRWRDQDRDTRPLSETNRAPRQGGHGFPGCKSRAGYGRQYLAGLQRNRIGRGCKLQIDESPVRCPFHTRRRQDRCPGA